MNRLSRLREAIPLSPKFAAPALTFMERPSRGWRPPAPSQFVEDLLLARGQGPICRCQVKDGAGPGQCLDVDGRDPKARRVGHGQDTLEDAPLDGRHRSTVAAAMDSQTTADTVQIVGAGRALLDETIVHMGEDAAAGVDAGEAVARGVHQAEEALALQGQLFWQVVERIRGPEPTGDGGPAASQSTE